VAELNRGIADQLGFRFDLVNWETDVFPGYHPQGPQAVIDPQLDIVNSDVVVGVFWRRFGTPTTDAQSGTVHEIQRACESWRTSKRPRVIVYFCGRAYAPNSMDEIQQWGQVIQFREKFGQTGLWFSYQDTDHFKDLVRGHLTAFLREQVSVAGGA
jgi:hypothetical protein